MLRRSFREIAVKYQYKSLITRYNEDNIYNHHARVKSEGSDNAKDMPGGDG